MTDTDTGESVLLDRVSASAGSVVIRSEDPEGDALRLVDALDAELIDDLDELPAAIAVRVEAARAATAGLGEVLVTIDELTALARRISDAEALVADSREAVRSKVGTTTGLVLHPDSMRGAATEVLSARAEVDRLEAALDQAVAADADWEREEQHMRADHATGADGRAPTDAEIARFAADDGAEDGDLGIPDDGSRRLVRRVVAILVLALLGGVVVLAAGGGPVGVIVPVITLLWVGFVVRRERADSYEDRDVEGRTLAADNLASIAGLTDQAYGGAGLNPWESDATRDTRAAIAHAERVLARAQDRWTALVGPNRSVDAIDDIVAMNDPQAGGLPAEIVDQSPTVRAAERHLRRLRAEWRVVWWVLDRPIPDEVSAATVESLAEEGIVSVHVLGAATGEASSDGPGPAIVVDMDGRIDEASFALDTAEIDHESRLVVVSAIV